MHINKEKKIFPFAKNSLATIQNFCSTNTNTCNTTQHRCQGLCLTITLFPDSVLRSPLVLVVVSKLLTHLK